VLPADAGVGVHEVTKRFDAVVALDGVSISFRPGEVHALLGENGSGKSTTVKLLSGVIRPDNGSVLVNGHEVNFHSPRQAINSGIAAVYQDSSLVPELTVGANILLGHEQSRLGLLGGRNLQVAGEWLQHVGLRIDPRRRTSTLSIGERQLVAIAKALSLQARVLIFDEPTATLTKPEIEHLFGLIDRLRTNSLVVVYITHRLAEVRRIADYITVLKDGRVVDTLPCADVTEQQVVRLMVGREVGSLFPPGSGLTKHPALVATDLVSRDGSVEVPSFTLHTGEIVGLAGIEGSGRSTLVRMLAGIDRLKSGTIIVDGQPVTHVARRRALRRRIGFVPPDRRGQAIFPAFSVGSSITLSSLKRLTRVGVLIPWAERKMAERARQDFRIRTASIAAPITTLSGGNQQKVILARIVASGVRILVCDEPTAGVDVGARGELYSLFRELTERGSSFVMSSSDLQELLGLCDRILVMRQGKIVAEYGRDEVTEEQLAYIQLPQQEGGESPDNDEMRTRVVSSGG
jgi:ABC-type sugar transport system ATPase subunit